MSSTTAPAAKKAAQHGGSHFSDKQIAQTVKDGSAVEVRLDGERHQGWIFGSDNFHWGLVDTQGVVTLVHKSVSHLKVLDDLCWEDLQEEYRARIEPLVAPFRAYVMKTYFGQNATS